MEHKEAQFTGYRDFNIYYQYWLPEENVKAVLIVAHGYAEHSGRY
ncbi:MAG: alpha/beta hydrolase, partial [Deltaproteobacteria bacterium]|nr:alpha/beta hydrolase [Deltaproteobacteria bacterium]